MELKQNVLLRMRMTRAGESEQLKFPRRKNKDRKDYRFRLDLDHLSGTEAMEVIEWLAFKREMEEIAFFSEEYQVKSS